MDLTRKSNESALNIKYVKMMKLLFFSVGAWPGEVFNEDLPLIYFIYRKSLPVQWICLIIGQIYFLITRFSTLPFLITGHVIITIFIDFVCFARFCLPNFKRYGVVIHRFFMNFHLVHFQGKGNKIFETTEKASYWFTVYLSSLAIGGLILFNLAPVYNNYKMGAFSTNFTDKYNRELSIYFSFPGFEPNDYYYIVGFINLMYSIYYGAIISSIDLFLSIMVFHIIGHIYLLKANLESFLPPTEDNGMYNSQENAEVQEKLKECVDYHRMIVNFTDEISDFFGPTLAIYYFFHLVSGCLLLLECSTGEIDAITRFGPLTLISIGQLMQISIVFEIVGDASEKLIDAVYCVPWESMNVSNRRMVLFFLRRVQQTIHVTAMGMMPIGVQTMAGILKTNFSYFMFLRSFS